MRLGTLRATLRPVRIARFGLHLDSGYCALLAGPLNRCADHDGAGRQSGHLGETYFRAIRYGGRRAGRVGIGAIAALVYRVTARRQMNLVIVTIAVPADRQLHSGDVRCDRLFNGDSYPRSRTDLGTGNLHRAATSKRQNRRQRGEGTHGRSLAV